jgi:pyruvate dehydrogenase E2 component (dihydrolipoamide acetyltransferase)
MEFKLPELGEGVHEGELVSWKVKVGDQVKYDQSLCEIMTDKATVEIPSAFQGKVASLHAKEGETVHVGQLLLAFEGAASKGAEAPAAEAPKADAPKAHAPKSAPQPSAASISAKSGDSSAPAPSTPARSSAPAMSAAPASIENLSPESRALAAPATRKLARESGINLGAVQGTGPNGRILKEDVERLARGGATGAGPAMPAFRGPTPAPYTPKSITQGGEERVPFKGLRKKIAEKMRESKDHAAHFTYVEEADATALVKLRNDAKELGAARGIKVTYLPFVMKAMVAALRQFPILNSELDEANNELVYKHYFNIALSIQTDDGLTAPVVKGVEQKTIFELAREIQDLVDRARHKKLALEDFHGGTITLTNAGSIGGLFATPIINYPEVAILGFNKIFRRAVPKMINGREKVVIRDWTYFSISLDHRVVDGAIGAEYMKTFVKYIENPSLLMLESL